jgi:hypothetical protein
VAEILGLGTVHSPPLMGPGDALRPPMLAGGGLLPDQAAWPAEMRRQWGRDEGRAYAAAHRGELIDGVRWIRRELDAFEPELVLMVGDDQYENFLEDCVPAFQVCAYEEFVVSPFADGRANSWQEPPSTTFRFSGHAAVGKQLASDLLDAGFDVAYAFKPLRAAMPHAFLNTILFLDWDRAGFPYPIVPLAINCYGRLLLPLRGEGVNERAQVPAPEQLAPPGPPPWRCFDLGVELGRLLAASPWRVALIATGSWSHSWLAPATGYLHPSVDADMAALAALEAGDYDYWRQRTTAELEEHGQQELLNWTCLLGAMAHLGRTVDETRFLASWVTNADKAFAVFRS